MLRTRQLGRIGRAEPDLSSEPNLQCELLRQRNRMEQTVDRLSSELGAAKRRTHQAMLTRGFETAQVLADQVRSCQARAAPHDVEGKSVGVSELSLHFA